MKNLPEIIECILFDLGGVVINIDWKKSVYAFAEMTNKSFDELNQLMRKEELVQRIETGEINPVEFREWFRNYFRKYFENNKIDLAWNAMLMDIPVERIEIIQDLKSDYQIMCLSNTNEIHIREFNSRLSSAAGIDKLEDLMHKTYYSHLLKTRKPDPQAWKIILEENQLTPESVLYFDDNKKNHEVALELGFKSILISANYTLENFFNE